MAIFRRHGFHPLNSAEYLFRSSDTTDIFQVDERSVYASKPAYKARQIKYLIEQSTY